MSTGFLFRAERLREVVKAIRACAPPQGEDGMLCWGGAAYRDSCRNATCATLNDFIKDVESFYGK